MDRPSKLRKILVFIAITIGLPLYFILWIIFYSFYLAVVSLSKFAAKGLKYPVSGVSAFLTPDKIHKRPNSVLVNIAVLQGNPDLKTVLIHLEKLYDSRKSNGSRMYDKLGYSCEYWYGYRFWKKIPSFKISDYVHFIEDRETTPENVNTFVEGIIRKPFENGKPLWEMFVLASMNANGDCYVVFRTHHILLDGMSLLKLWYKVDGEDKIPSDLIKYNTFTPRPVPLWKRWFTNLKLMIMAQYLSNRILSVPNDNNCLTKECKDFDGDWYCSPVKKIRLDEYRRHIRALNFSITHVILVAYTRGFKRFVEKYYGSEQIPNTVTIYGSVPTPTPPNNIDALTNHWAIIRYQAKLRTTGLKDQLTDAKTEYTSQIKCIVPEVFELMTGLMGYLPGLVPEYGLNTRKSGTLSISNIPGPSHKQKMFNLPVSDRALWLPLTRGSCGLGLIFLTYNGWGNFTMTADTGYVKNRGAFDDLHRMVLEELKFVLDEVVKMADTLRSDTGVIEPHSLSVPTVIVV